VAGRDLRDGATSFERQIAGRALRDHGFHLKRAGRDQPTEVEAAWRRFIPADVAVARPTHFLDFGGDRHRFDQEGGGRDRQMLPSGVPIQIQVSIEFGRSKFSWAFHATAFLVVDIRPPRAVAQSKRTSLGATGLGNIEKRETPAIEQGGRQKSRLGDAGGASQHCEL